MRYLHILHTNDIHSHFESMPHVASCIQYHKKKWEREGDKVVVIDIGDHADRARMKTEASWGHSNIDVMNQTGYEWTTLGNNEGLTFPKERLQHLYDNSHFTVLCSNFKEKETLQPPPFIKPYAIQQVDDIRIGLIGVTASFPDFYRLLGWEVEDPLIVLSQMVPKLRKEVDLLIVLSHIGLPGDRLMAEQIEGIDLILGAHTHHLLHQGEKIKNTWIAQAGKFGKYVGHIKIDHYKNQRFLSNKMEIEVFNTEEYEADHQVSELIRSHLHEAEDQMNEVVAELDRDLHHDIEQESPLGNILAEGLRKWTGAEIGMVNSGQFLFSLSKGPVRRKNILSLLPHPINPCYLQLTGKQIKTILEETLLEENIHRSFKGFGFRGKLIGWMCVDGLEVTYNPSRPLYQKITQIETRNGPLQYDKKYKVGTIDMFTFGVLFPAFAEGEEKTFFLPEFLRDVFVTQLKDVKAVEQGLLQRWHVSYV